MKKIEGYPITVSKLLNNTKYTIDFYQREYRWGEQQISDLLSDLESAFFNNYEEGDNRVKVESYGYYFLGSIVKTIKEGKNYIVDGQQRLTTLTLLLIFLRNLQKEQNRTEDNSVNIDLMILSSIYGRKSFNIEDPEDPDRNNCMDALFNDNEFDINGTSESIQNIVKCYNYIKLIFSEALQDVALPHFIEWLSHKVQLIEIVTSTDDDAYFIFETMNDRGLSLTPVEMLKGYLLANIEITSDQQEMNLLWKKWILKLKDIEKEEDSNFIKAWFRAKYANSIREAKKGAIKKDFGKIGSEFHKWFREQEERIRGEKSVKDFISHEFDKFAKYYFLIRKASKVFTPGYEYIYYNAVNNFTLQYPLILAPLKTEDDEDTIFKKIRLVSGYIDIFIARRVVNYRTLRYSSILYTIFNLIKEIRNLDVKSLANKLTESINKMDESFDAVMKFKLRRGNKRFVKPLLARMTYHIEKKSMKESNYENYISREIKKPFEIEHIWGNNYDQHKDEFLSEDEFLDYRQNFGNLILIPRGFNQSLGADTYENKVKAYFGQNLLAQSLNHLCYKNNPSFLSFIKDSKLLFQPHLEFKKEDLDKRQELYRGICEKIWDPIRFNESIS